MSCQLNHVAFCGGGSGGHLTPAIAIAEELRRRQPASRLTFCASARKIDQQVLGTWIADSKNSQVLYLPLRSSSRRLIYAGQIIRSTWQCVNLFRKQRPDLVVGTGGFASIPGVLAARWLKIPIALLEPNCVCGRANRMLSRWAATVFVSPLMPLDQRQQLNGSLVELAVPVRRVFSSDVNFANAERQQTVLVLGGSLGAQSLNDTVLEAVTGLQGLPSGWRLLHQAGTQDAPRLSDRYREHENLSVTVLEFLDDVADRLRQSAIVVSRAGAVAIAEIAATATPAILVPLCSAADNHQAANAAHYAKSGAAIVLSDQQHGAAEELAGQLRRLCGSLQERQAMSAAAATTGSAGSSAEIAVDCLYQLS